MAETLNLTLKVWRQDGPHSKGKIVSYDAKEIPNSASFLEMFVYGYASLHSVESVFWTHTLQTDTLEIDDVGEMAHYFEQEDGFGSKIGSSGTRKQCRHTVGYRQCQRNTGC